MLSTDFLFPRQLPTDSHKDSQQQIDQHDKFCQLSHILSNDPIHWKDFLDVDRQLSMSPEYQESLACSFAWILAHYPPSYVVYELLLRYRNVLFHDRDAIINIFLVALRHNSDTVIRFIASNYPYIMSQRLDASGDLPLHRVCNLDIALMVLQCYPAAVNVPNFANNLPLHSAIENFPHPEYVKALIIEGLAKNVGGDEGCGGVLVQNQSGKTPFDILNHQFATGIDLVTLLGSPIFEIEKRMWNNLVTMIRAILHVGCTLAEDFLILHEIITLKCPPQAVCLGQIMSPYDITRADYKGRYPLHLACSQHRCCKVVIEHLLHAFPGAASLCDATGKCPLHYCAIGGRSFSEGTEAVYHAHPSAATISDQDGFYPFMFAASTLCPTDTIFRLLRECPWAIECY